MAHLEDTLRLLGEEATKSFHRRWHSFPHNLQVREPHSSNDLQVAFLRTPWYKETMRKLKTKWIGLNMNPPLLLPVAPMADINKDKEEEEWEEIVKTKGYHEQQAITRYIAWDIR
jgi:hypothetical protein